VKTLKDYDVTVWMLGNSVCHTQ